MIIAKVINTKVRVGKIPLFNYFIIYVIILITSVSSFLACPSRPLQCVFIAY